MSHPLKPRGVKDEKKNVNHFRAGILALFYILSSVSPSLGVAAPPPDKDCKYNFLKRVVIDLQVEETRNGRKLRIFRPDSAVGRMLNGVAGLFERKFRLHILANVIHNLETSLDSSRPYFRQLSDAFELKPVMHGESFTNVPKSGPVVFYANHPLSGADAFALLAEIEKTRPDIKVVAANFLESIPGFKDHAFIVNNLGTPAAKAHNQEVIAGVNRHVREGKALLIFPSGSISAWEGGTPIYAKDIDWKNGMLRFGAQSPETRYFPVFVGGQPSRAYLEARQNTPKLSAAYVIRELGGFVGEPIDLTLGRPHTQAQIALLPEGLRIPYLRAHLYDLGTDYFRTTYPGGTGIYGKANTGIPPLLSRDEYTALQSGDLILNQPRH